MIPQPGQAEKAALVAAARAAVTRSFLTKDGGTRYGAAVLTLTGQILQTGQYSSFNHSTNVHAEQAALALAALSGDPDVVMLAVASTAKTGVTRPCGVCRQVMIEHAQRTGRDFLVLMARNDGGWEEEPVSALLPNAWAAASAATQSHSHPDDRFFTPPGAAGKTSGSCEPSQIRTGDHLLLDDRLLALVWDPAPWPASILVKIKYHRLPEGVWRKNSHAFTEPFAYERELAELPGLRGAPCGAPAAAAAPEQIRSVYPSLPVSSEDIPAVLREILGAAGLGSHNLLLTGSRATGLHTGGSDADWLLRAPPSAHWKFAAALAAAFKNGRVILPAAADSASCRLLDRCLPGGLAAAISRGAPPLTFLADGRKHSLFPVPDPELPPLHSASASFRGHISLEGVVEDDSLAPLKRAGFTLRQSCGRPLSVACYHKLGNFVRAGDRLAVSGWLAHEPDGRQILIQFHPHRDRIVWFPPVSP